MKRTPWSVAVALGLLAVVLAGCATGRQEIATDDRKKNDSKHNCDWSYQLEPNTAKVKKGSVELSEPSKKIHKCEVVEIAPPISIGGADLTKGMQVTSVRGGDVAFDLDGILRSQEMPRGWCYRCYPDGNGGWTCVRYPC